MKLKNCIIYIILECITTFIIFLGAVNCVISICFQPIVVIYWISFIVFTVLTSLLIEDIKIEIRRIRASIRWTIYHGNNEFFM